MPHLQLVKLALGRFRLLRRGVWPKRFYRATWVLPFVFGGCNPNEGELFNVTASLTDTTCGTGVLDADDHWDFQVRLALDGETLTWYDVDTADSSQGSLTDGEFSVSTGNTYVVTEATTVSVGCSVRRHDKFSGDASLDDAGAIETLKGTLVQDYSEATGYNCDALIGEADGFEDLPCEISYSFVASPD
jgi:hypothetical protein